MAVSVPFLGSGEFAQKREWSCSQHSFARTHECDCEHCDREWDCEECRAAEWLDLLNEDGSPQMVELSNLDVMLRRQFQAIVGSRSIFREWQDEGSVPLPRFVRHEDDDTSSV